MITATRLRKLFHYDPESGVFSRLAGGRGIRCGVPAGSLDGCGYRQITVDGKNYKAHRLAWLYMTGKWPVEQIDHINMARSDNRWKNLREATSSQNRANSRGLITSKSKMKGVTWHPRGGKWQAQITVNRKTVYLGVFADPADAHDAYSEAAKKHFGKFARTA